MQGGLDVAFRFGTLSDSSLTARYIAPNYRVLCASPEYIAKHGEPRSPSELARHPFIVYGARSVSHWTFQVDDEPVSVAVRGAFLTNDGGAAHALAGAGIFYKSIWDVAADLESGRLVR